MTANLSSMSVWILRLTGWSNKDTLKWGNKVAVLK